MKALRSVELIIETLAMMMVMVNSMTSMKLGEIGSMKRITVVMTEVIMMKSAR